MKKHIGNNAMMRSLFFILIFLSAPVWAADVPFRADSGLTKAEAQLAEGHYMQALETLSLVLNRRPKDADALTYTGYAWHQLGDMKKALQFFDRALASDPKHLGANKYKADIYIKAGKFAQAYEQMQVLRMACGGTDCAELTALQFALNKAKAEK